MTDQQYYKWQVEVAQKWRDEHKLPKISDARAVELFFHRYTE